MIKIALCDDIVECSKKIEKDIRRYGKEKNRKVKIDLYDSGGRLLLNLQRKKYDLMFLDVFMPKMDGFEIAKKVREIDSDIVIVFCTSYYTIANATKGYAVEAEDFLSRPILYKKIEKILNKVYEKKLIDKEDKLFLKCQDGLITIRISDIIYIQTEIKSVVLYTINDRIKCNQKLGELESRLREKQFYRCHNSYIVNLDYVERLKDNDVLVKDSAEHLKPIPVSKYKRIGFLNALAQYMGNQID